MEANHEGLGELIEARPLAKGIGKPKVYRLKSKKFPVWVK